LPGEGNPSTVRERARNHLRGLLATSAVTGAAAQLASCIPVVCDPMPPPLVCDANQTTDYYLYQFVGVQAHWVIGAGNVYSVAVVISSYATAADKKIVFTANPVLVGATLGSVDRTETQVSFSFTPTASVSEVRFDVAINCNAVADTLRLRVDVSGPRSNNANIPVQSGEIEG